MKWNHSFLVFFFTVILAIGKVQITKSSLYGDDITILPNDARLNFGGRWLYANVGGKEMAMKADWPCSDIKFEVNVEKSGAKLPLIWYGKNTRVSVRKEKISDDATSMDIFEGGRGSMTRLTNDVVFESAGKYSVTVRKLTTSAPYGNGLGLFLGSSTFDFLGFGSPEGISLVSSSPKKRKIVAIGASDTAGSCIDGNPNKTETELLPTLWKYDNCDSTYVAELGRKFDAEISVQALSGAGITRNAFSQQNNLGKTLLSEFFNRTLQLNASSTWNFSEESYVDLVIVSLGGNDFNNQNGNVPSNETFTSEYSKFLSYLFQVYKKPFDEKIRNQTQIVVVCGMGDPSELVRNTDNNRCRPCPFVQDSVTAFKEANQDIAPRLHYKFVPCDGSIVTGSDDLSCGGHKNPLGQSKVANYLTSYLTSVTGWQVKESPTDPSDSSTAKMTTSLYSLLLITLCTIIFINW